MAGTCECGNGPSGSIKFGVFLDWLGNCQLLTEEYTACSQFLVGWLVGWLIGWLVS